MPIIQMKTRHFFDIEHFRENVLHRSVKKVKFIFEKQKKNRVILAKTF